MITYNVNDESFLNSSIYKNFLMQNPEQGNLKIRAYAASQALPIAGLRIVVSAIIDDAKVIFFEGVTDESGVIEEISLPAPKIDPDNLIAPNKMTYDIEATYIPDDIRLAFKANIYENLCVVQNINIVPKLNINRRGYYGY